MEALNVGTCETNVKFQQQTLKDKPWQNIPSSMLSQNVNCSLDASFFLKPSSLGRIFPVLNRPCRWGCPTNTLVAD